MTSAAPQPPESNESIDHGVAPGESLGRRKRLERGDDVVQHLTVAKYALAVGDVAAADAAVDAALSSSRRTLTDLVDSPSSSPRAGTLVRTEPTCAATAEETPSDPADPTD
jgi:hypothetical protein